MVRYLLLLLVLPGIVFGYHETYKDTLRVTNALTPAEWSAEGDSVTSDLWYNDGSDAIIEQISGDTGAENHHLAVEDFGGAYSFYGGGATVDYVVLVYEIAGIGLGSGGCRLGVIVDGDTTWGTTRTSPSTYRDTLAAPNGRTWDVDNIDSVSIFIDGLATLGVGEDITIDYTWLEVTFSTAETTEGLKARYLSVLFDHDSCFTFDAWNGEGRLRISVDTDRTNEYDQFGDSTFIWKQFIQSKPSFSSALWYDTFAVTTEMIDIIYFAPQGYLFACLHRPQGMSLQSNYTKGNGDSVEYIMGKIFHTGDNTHNMDIIDANGDTLSTDFDDSMLFIGAFDGGFFVAVDTTVLDTATFPIEMSISFSVVQRGQLAYPAIDWDRPLGRTSRPQIRRCGFFVRCSVEPLRQIGRINKVPQSVRQEGEKRRQVRNLRLIRQKRSDAVLIWGDLEKGPRLHSWRTIGKCSPLVSHQYVKHSIDRAVDP